MPLSRWQRQIGSGWLAVQHPALTLVPQLALVSVQAMPQVLVAVLLTRGQLRVVLLAAQLLLLQAALRRSATLQPHAAVCFLQIVALLVAVLQLLLLLQLPPSRAT